MRFDRSLVAIVAVSCVCVVLPRRAAADEMEQAVALQIERSGQFIVLAFELH